MKNPKTGKYSFLYFVAALESEDFDVLRETDEDFAIDFVVSMIFTLTKEHHEGDCTLQNHSCNLCVLQDLLEQYAEYYFNEEEFRKTLNE